jgi:hypothetical protein
MAEIFYQSQRLCSLLVGHFSVFHFDVIDWLIDPTLVSNAFYVHVINFFYVEFIYLWDRVTFCVTIESSLTSRV